MVEYYLLLFIYTIVPPITLFFTLKSVYRDKNKYGIHLQYMFKYLFSLSFLPLLFLPNLKLGLIPQNSFSLLFIILTFCLAILGIKRAIRFKNLFFYFSGITAAFMEEILYRGIIFSLILFISNNQWMALIVSSFLFGAWHLKNYYWSGKRNIVIQFFYTFLIYGPVFGLMRIITGDIYLAILFHYITNATCALAPDWLRGWFVFGGRGKDYDDKAIIK